MQVLSCYKTSADCAQGWLGVTPDLCILGKGVGGGAPLSVFGGRADVMGACSPLGASAHSGTYNGHL